ncbi:MAG: phosphoglycolate phosphatase [Candidatus Bathyarchaeia archaeon]
MNVAAVATDVDGTITDKVYRLSCPAIRSIRALERAKVPVILASGNALLVMTTLQAYIGCSGGLICEGGGVVEYREETRILGERKGPLAALEALKKRFGDRVVESKSNPYRYVDVALRRTIPRRAVEGVIASFPSLSLWDSGYAYHIIDSKVDKGLGLRNVAEMMGLDPQSIVAIGDSETDVPLFKASGISIAVGNADTSLKRVATRVMTGRDGRGFKQAVDLILSGSLA